MLDEKQTNLSVGAADLPKGLESSTIKTTTSAISQDRQRLDPPKEEVRQILDRSGLPKSFSRYECDALVQSQCSGLDHVDYHLVSQRVFDGMYDGIAQAELEDLVVRTSAMLIAEEPEYSKLSARFLHKKILGELSSRGLHKFSDSIRFGHSVGLFGDTTKEFVLQNEEELNNAIRRKKTNLFEFFGLKTVYDRYLQKDPVSRDSVECPQFFFMRVACGLSYNVKEAIEFYNIISSFDYMPATPTLFNSGTQRPQMSSCYLLDSPVDSLESIYGRYTEIAKLSKFAGGIGLAYHRIRARGSLIQGTNGYSNGIIPFLKTLDSSVSAVNQGGKRKGACCVYLESWHADIIDFLDLRENTGDEALRTHNLNLANWISNIFMERVQQDGDWSLFDPKDVPHFPDLYGDAFSKAYIKAEGEGLAKATMKARDLYGKMMKSLAQTGNGWINFKDHSNQKANQTLKSENVIHLSNLCTEILEVTSDEEVAVCNLGSINLAKYVKSGEFDFSTLAQNVRTAAKYLDRVVDINFYPVEKAKGSNNRWRPVGLGVMGLQDVFFQLGLAFDDPKALELSSKIQEEIYYNALKTSLELAKKLGPHPAFKETRAAQGELQFDLWGVTPSDSTRWDALKKEIVEHGLRNSLMIAVAPTATIASIVGSYECIEPQISNIFKRETLSGEFLQVNSYLVQDLRKLDLWTDAIKTKIKMNDGSIQSIQEIPEGLRKKYRTAWELPMRVLIDLAAARGAYIDQSQSLNLFMESPTIGKLSSMYMYAWKKGLKTTYYLRSRPATKINKTIGSQSDSNKKSYTDEQALACSLENPESCDSCQ